MGLQADLREASDVMVNFAKLGGPIPAVLLLSDTTTDANTTTNTTTQQPQPQKQRYLLAGRSHIALSSGCELFLKYVTRASLETPDFTTCKSQVLERGERFAEFSLAARDRISSVGGPFVREGSVVLTHGRSRVVESLLLRAALVERKRFRVMVLEGRPDAAGAKSARTYERCGIPTTVVLDSAMGYVMERVDMVIVGAEGVVENGGVVNKVGTFSLGVMAKELGVPFYVAAESYKFTRLYPLNNSDLPEMGGIGESLQFLDTLNWSASGSSSSRKKDGDEKKEEGSTMSTSTTRLQDVKDYIVNLPSTVEVQNPPCDFTPAKYITLLFTDLGVLTPSAVSDELIRLYQ